METISGFLRLDLSNLIISIFLIMAGIIAMAEIIGKLSKLIGHPVKWVQNKEKDHEVLNQTIKQLTILQQKYEESVKQSIRHDEMLKEDILKLTNTVNSIVDTLQQMQEKDNETKLQELQDCLIRYYNKYKEIGKWSKLEKQAFWNLFEEYEKRGGNGYIHSIVEPGMRELKEIE